MMKFMESFSLHPVLLAKDFMRIEKTT
jgi:hypothetical protein